MRATRLDNGLKVLIQEEHTAPLASVWCWYKVGSKDERPGLTGVSHWGELMNFQGTANIPPECSMIPLTCPRGMFAVPLKFMWSTQCDPPVRPGGSSFAPTL